VASDVGGHRELIRHGETGCLFEAGNADALADAVDQLLDRRHEWPRLRAAGRDFVESERNWRASIAQYRPVFESLVSSVPA
jgi:glycosyltransferase involved in cell wall biosynthesis